jgi:hypothetical protein
MNNNIQIITKILINNGNQIIHRMIMIKIVNIKTIIILKNIKIMIKIKIIKEINFNFKQ